MCKATGNYSTKTPRFFIIIWNVWTDHYYAPAHRAEALSNDACLTTSVAYIGPMSRTERPRKTEIGTEVAHITRDSDTTFKVKGQFAGGGVYCGSLPHSLFWWTCTKTDVWRCVFDICSLVAGLPACQVILSCSQWHHIGSKMLNLKNLCSISLMETFEYNTMDPARSGSGCGVPLVETVEYKNS